jgi:DNA-binding transcriptional LysR family regulator
LSRQIHALEAELGVTLFDRNGRQVRLTAEGEDLLHRSRHLLDEAEALAEHARGLKVGETGILRVGATPQVIASLLAGFLHTHAQRHPAVEVHLVEDGGIRLRARLDRGEVHLILAGADGMRRDHRPLYPMHLLAGVAPTHRFARRPVLEIAELAEEPLLLLHRGFASREWFDAACRVASIRPRVLLESSAPQTLVALAATAYGVAILPSNVQGVRGDIAALPLVHRRASIGSWAHVAWDPRRPLARYAERFVTELVAHCGRRYPGRDLIRRAPPLPKPRAEAAVPAPRPRARRRQASAVAASRIRKAPPGGG